KISPQEHELTPLSAVGLTYQSPDGNHLVTGKGDLPNTIPIDIPLNGKPVWIVAVPTQEGSLWAAVLEDGSIQANHVVDKTYSAVELGVNNLPVGMPPILTNQEGAYTLFPPISGSRSLVTHPIPLSGNYSFAYIGENGNLLLENGGETDILEANALPDGRILVDDNERLLFLSSPTTRYNHGIAGDDIEAASITLVGTSLPPRVIREIPIPDGQVVEGISPIWFDINADGQREIIVTVSDANQGAQILIFNESGEQIAQGQPIGQGYRWRHQIAVAPFGPNGEIELVDVLTPHIGGVIEFFQLKGDQLVLVAQLRGYTSHVIGSRNLDMAAAGDFDGDGIVEILIPSQNLGSLALIQRTLDGVKVDWELDLGATLTTNLAAVTCPSGDIAVGIGLDSGVIRLWLP
ncbi:MAG: hypothetical protein N2D54_02635, partial [Chloroflexota bacterium]